MLTFQYSYTLSPDTNFDELIEAIYGDVEQLEKDEQDEITKLNKKNMNNAYAESRKRGILYQAEQRVSEIFAHNVCMTLHSLICKKI